MIDFSALLYGPHFQLRGRPAEFRSKGSTPGIPCRILVEAQDDATDIGGRRIISAQRIVKVRVSEVPERPDRKDVFVTEAETLTVAQAARKEGADGQIWICLCDPNPT